MIKHEIKTKYEAEPSFPCLVNYTAEKECIILMTSPRSGTVLTDSTLFKKGHFSDDWKFKNFELFTGVLELSNDFI